MADASTRPLHDDVNPPSASDDAVVARCEGLRKVYGSGAGAVVALDHLDLTLRPGEVVALTGPSGSGKSTLLHILGAMDTPSGGVVEVLGHDLSALDDEAQSVFRNRHLGFIFQFFHLVPSLTVAENIALPARLGGARRDAIERLARPLAERVGLGAMLDRFPDQLSGGQRQRVAMARALVNEPALVLADEPTGNLDHSAGGEVMRLLVELARERDVAVLVATHDPAVTAAAHREVVLADGRRVS
ncbi:MAG: ABC transporter ATP-binding protein [Planctomycetota bacterium]